jgi:hypothetical protein
LHVCGAYTFYPEILHSTLITLYLRQEQLQLQKQLLQQHHSQNLLWIQHKKTFNLYRFLIDYSTR